MNNDLKVRAQEWLKRMPRPLNAKGVVYESIGIIYDLLAALDECETRLQGRDDRVF